MILFGLASSILLELIRIWGLSSYVRVHGRAMSIDGISTIQSTISNEVDEDERVADQVRVCDGKADLLLDASSPISDTAAYKAS
jgi:hypothetical protein